MDVSVKPESAGSGSCCPCCGVPTKRLFAPGHDARFKGQLARAAHEAGSFDDAKVDYFVPGVPGGPTGMTVTEAVSRVDAVLHTDWAAKIAKSVDRLAGKPSDTPVRERSRKASPSKMPTRSRSGSDRSLDRQDTSLDRQDISDPSADAAARRERYLQERARDEASRAKADERVSALMDRLDSQPKTGEWGWYRPAAPTEAQRTVRFPARVHRTYRAEGIFGVDLLIVKTSDDGAITRELVLDVLPALWMRDPDAKS